MEYLLQKAFEGASQKYTPEQMAAILDKMVEAHNYLAKLCYGWGLVFIACFTILFVLAIRSEINYRKLKKKLVRHMGQAGLVMKNHVLAIDRK